LTRAAAPNHSDFAPQFLREFFTVVCPIEWLDIGILLPLVRLDEFELIGG
jgi:hypothetical protein